MFNYGKDLLLPSLDAIVVRKTAPYVNEIHLGFVKLIMKSNLKQEEAEVSLRPRVK